MEDAHNPVVPFPSDETERERIVADLLQDEPQTSRWQITDRASAWWAMRQLAKARARMLENKQLWDAESRRLAQWLEEENRPWERTAAYFEGRLAEWHWRLLASDPQAKTVKTPYGSMQLRAAPQEWRYHETGLLAWLQANRPDLIRVTQEPNKADLKKAVDLRLEADGTYRAILRDSGEFVEGVTIHDRPPTHTVKIDPEEVPGL